MLMLDEKDQQANEKAELPSYADTQARPTAPAAVQNRTRKLVAIWTVSTLVGLAQYWAFWHNPPRTIKPIEGIVWHTCPDVTDTQCGTLTVPLDYTGTVSNDTVSLALRKLPATAPLEDRLGSLLLNPGGPIRSGHAFVIRYGHPLSVILEGRYDIVSWDPRSVNLTSPSLDCFETHGDSVRFKRDTQQLGLPYDVRGPLSSLSLSSPIPVGENLWGHKMDAYQRTLNGACVEKGNQLMLQASSTAFVARDMKSIIEALGEAKLSYWGFSYGTILGATFSAMFPELVHRVVLDGVADSQLWTSDILADGKNGMEDTAKTLEGFFQSCADSGPKGCALARHGDTATSIRERFDTLREKLRLEPLSVPASKVGPGILTASDVDYLVFRSLYKPKGWPEVAEALAQLENGNGTLVYEAVDATNNDLSRKWHDNPFHRNAESTLASTAVVMCSDTNVTALQEDLSVDSFVKYARELESISPTGSIWAVWATVCRHWSFKAIESFRGPWTVADGFRKTNFPVLFVSNTADPVTPLSAAKTMSSGFGKDSASLLVQNGLGHCSSSHPSLCTAKAIRAYFLEGIVPAYNTQCEVDPGFLFPHPSNDTASGRGEMVRILSEEDRRLAFALKELSGASSHFMRGL